MKVLPESGLLWRHTWTADRQLESPWTDKVPTETTCCPVVQDDIRPPTGTTTTLCVPSKTVGPAPRRRWHKEDLNGLYLFLPFEHQEPEPRKRFPSSSSVSSSSWFDVHCVLSVTRLPPIGTPLSLHLPVPVCRSENYPLLLLFEVFVRQTVSPHIRGFCKFYWTKLKWYWTVIQFLEVINGETSCKISKQY